MGNFEEKEVCETITLCHENKSEVLKQLRSGKIDSVALSTSSLVDDIILETHTSGVLDCLKNGIPDKRAHNTIIPFDLIWVLSIAAKMKTHTALSDIPHAISDQRLLSKLGYGMISDDHEGLGTDLMRESSLRYLLGKYSAKEFVDYYNTVYQDHIAPKLDISPNIHILDCTDLEVNIDNPNYEKSGISVSKHGGHARGYKMATIRGIYQDTGVIEEIRCGAINTHDYALSEEMVRTSKVLKPGDIFINDRGFISRELMNYIKTIRGVDTYVPLKKNMEAYKYAVEEASSNQKWYSHPNRKRTKQKIAFVSNIGTDWVSSSPKNDVPINSCVVWDTEADEYFVFVTTDITKSAKEIIKTYELRPEVEEDYRQLKDFWGIEDFKSTKVNVIAFHVVCTLFGYLFFQLYKTTDEGSQYAGKSLPVVLKGYQPKVQRYMVVYVKDMFGIFPLVEFMDIYAKCNDDIKGILRPILEYA